MSTLALHQVDCNDTITNSFRHKLHGNSMLLHGRHGGVPAFLIKSCVNYILSSARSLGQIVETWRVQITKLCQAIQTQDHKSDSTCSSNTACRRLHIAVRRRLCATNRNPASESLANGKPDLRMCTPSAETQYLTSPAHTFISDKTAKLQQVEYTS